MRIFKFFSFFKRKKKSSLQNEEENLRKEQDYLKSILRTNELREEVYKAIEGNIRKRLEKAKKNSEKGKTYIDEDPTILGGKHR